MTKTKQKIKKLISIILIVLILMSSFSPLIYGAEEEYKKIKIGYDNNYFKNATINYVQ